MQSAWSRIWTRVAVSISYDDNHYTTGTSTNSWGIREVHNFTKGISPKVNVIAWLVFEVFYFETVAQYVSHYTTKTLPEY